MVPSTDSKLTRTSLQFSDSGSKLLNGDIVPMRVEANTDIRTLRRIALLVTRLREHAAELNPELNAVTAILDRIKRRVALEEPLSSDEFREMARLVAALTTKTAAPTPLNQATVGELRELLAHISPRTRRHHISH